MRYDYSSIGFITFDCLGWPFVEMPQGGGTHMVEDFALAVSGAAGTAAIAAAKMGLSVQAVGGVGGDLMGDWVRRRLEDFAVIGTTIIHGLTAFVWLAAGQFPKTTML